MCGIDFTSQWWNVSSWRHRSLDSHKGRLCRLSLYSVTMDGWMDRLWGNSGLSLTLVSFISMTMLCFLSSSGSWNLSVTCFTVYFFSLLPLNLAFKAYYPFSHEDPMTPLLQGLTLP